VRAGGFREGRHQLAADHEALLVGQREVDPLPQRRHRRPEPRGADQRVQHEVAVGVRDQLHEPLGAAQHGGVLAGARGGVGIGQRDALHAEAAGLLEQ
jgi:hypothetical protein